MSSRPTIAIIGAGFTGTMVAARLLHAATSAALRLVIVNRSGRVARGVAYGTRSSRHVLNVPAGRMSAFSEDEDDFLRFVQARDRSATGGSFVSRQLYGEYLEHILMSAQARASRGTVLEQVADEVVAIRPHASSSSGASMQLACGDKLSVDRVVLALGNYPPSDPSLPDRSLFASPRYVRDPWSPGALESIPDHGTLLIVGTGLTMIDVVLELVARGRTSPMIAVSRRGLLPQPHREHTAPPSYAHLPPELVACEPSAVAYLRAVRRHIRRMAAKGLDWRDIVASLRPVTPRLWQALSTTERRRFLRHLRPYWEVHRHRVAPELWRAFDEARRSRLLTVRAARITAARETGDALRVSLGLRRGAAMELAGVTAVVNCTGPESDLRCVRDPLMQDLITHGNARPDPLGLGLDVDDDYALLNAAGRPSGTLSLVGPLLKGRYWEATAVPELRVHAARLAARLTAELSLSAARRTA